MSKFPTTIEALDEAEDLPPLCMVLPDEFLRVCIKDGVSPEVVMHGFIADLCGLYLRDYRTFGPQPRRLAIDYYLCTHGRWGA
jgi:hypothetical protein